MSADKAGNRIIALGALIAPAVAAMGVRFISPSPAAAVAGVPQAAETSATAAAVSPEVPLGAQQIRAKEMGATPVEKSLATPFLTAVDAEQRAIPVVENHAEGAVEAKVTRGPMALTSIFAGKRTVAIINGRVRRVGDDVEPGWKVTAIEPDAGQVTVENTKQNQSVTLRIHKIATEPK